MTVNHAPLVSMNQVDRERRFGSVDRAFGRSVTDQLAVCHVTIAGIGGVGSWAAEALARSGVGQLTLIDMDHVAESNINRQAHALDSTLGQAKIGAMQTRIHDINPACQVTVCDDFVSPENVHTLVNEASHVVLDCTDQLSAKIALVLCCRERGQPLIVCGAAGGKTNALSLQAGDLRDSTHDALLARLRTTLRKRHGFAPAGTKRVAKLGVPVLWFSQPTHRPDNLASGEQAGSPLACAGYGSLVTVTAAMGLAAAGQALAYLVRSSNV